GGSGRGGQGRRARGRKADRKPACGERTTAVGVSRRDRAALRKEVKQRLGEPALTLPGTRANSHRHRTENPEIAVNEIRRPAAFSAPSDLPLATHLRSVDPPPRFQRGAERRDDSARLVAGCRRFGAGGL